MTDASFLPRNRTKWVPGLLQVDPASQDVTGIAAPSSGAAYSAICSVPCSKLHKSSFLLRARSHLLQMS